MVRPGPDILGALGVPGHALEPLATAVVRTSSVGRGTGAAPLEDLLGPRREKWSFEPVEVPEAALLDLRHAAREPGVYLADVSGLLVRYVGRHAPYGPGVEAIDARASTAAVLARRGGSGVVWVFRGAEAQAFAVVEADGEPDLPVPPLEALGEGVAPEPFLEALYREGAVAGTLFARVAGVAAVARLWMPRSRGERADPVEVARRWLAGVGPRIQAALEAAALVEVHALAEELEVVMPALTGATVGARARARRLLHRRDDLASVLFLLRRVDQGAELAEALEGLDRRAGELALGWRFVAPFEEDDRLLAVSWQEPEAWWGRLALPA